jgi:MoxR-like ATPase
MHRCPAAVHPLVSHRTSMPSQLPSSVDETLALLSSQDYIGGRRFATALYLSLRTGRPLFLEGEAGVGKTEVAKVVSKALGRTLLRLQCYEGLDIANAVYEWNYPRQMIEIRMAEASGGNSKSDLASDIFREEFLIKRPLMQAISNTDGEPPVLLIDELDRADEPFEAYLLEVLADFQITIPELGTIHASTPPIVVITSNRTREIHDAIKRRCLYHWVDYPDQRTELEIVRRKVPQAPDTLSRQIVAFVARLRGMELYKQPGIAETIDWAQCLSALDKSSLDPETVSDTVGVLLKYQDDITRLDADSMIVDLTAEVQGA